MVDQQLAPATICHSVWIIFRHNHWHYFQRMKISSEKSKLLLRLTVNISCVLAVLIQLTFILRKTVPKKSTFLPSLYSPPIPECQSTKALAFLTSPLLCCNTLSCSAPYQGTRFLNKKIGGWVFLCGITFTMFAPVLITIQQNMTQRIQLVMGQRLQLRSISWVHSLDTLHLRNCDDFVGEQIQNAVANCQHYLRASCS